MSLQKSRYWMVVFTFVFALLLDGPMFASVTASISGTVKDASGASVAGAMVTATDTGTGISQTRTTNAQGFYSFQELPLGSYVVTVSQKGFKEYQQTNLGSHRPGFSQVEFLRVRVGLQRLFSSQGYLSFERSEPIRNDESGLAKGWVEK